MTIPLERSLSLKSTREFLRSLLDPKLTPKIPKSLRKQAYWCLRHFPHEYEIQLVAKECPDVFGMYENKEERKDVIR